MLPPRFAWLAIVCAPFVAAPVFAQTAAGPAPLPTGQATADAPVESADETAGAAAPESGDGFRFGTYGRVGIGWDGRGGTSQPFSVVAHGPRLEQPAYLELDLGYALHPTEDVGLRILTTIAVFEELFHFTGNPLESIAIRNLYVESTWKDWLALWAGSRMYRGDDVYLFDWWPLDNLNTVGGGLSVAFDAYRIAAQVGMNRLDDEWQTQWFESPDPIHGTRSSLTLDRPRTLVSLKAERLSLPEGPDDLGWKVALYGEGHFISSGTLIHPDRTEEELPDDQGWVAGAQGGLWDDDGDFLNLWVRTSGGLAAYGELSIPFGVDEDKRALDAREFALVAAGNLEVGEIFGLLGGGYARWFRDADRNVYDLDDAWEVALAVRPHFYITEQFHVAAEISWQMRASAGLAPESEQPETPQIWKFAVMPMWVPFGPGTLSRPQIRLVYQISVPNDAARHTLAEDDPRRDHSVEHMLGIQVEWWYNSSYR
ncbi:MAG: carbohydrate porin [Deltaproteobacteria bacterium]|nr:carbohydrate porin [Deltaproteobacteria bacterium]